MSVFEAAHVGKSCEFCGSSLLVDYEEIKAPIRPQSLLPYRVDRSRVPDLLRRWWAGRWLAPSRLKRQAFLDEVHGVYLPFWTFDARAHCPWTADAGHYYYTSETYRDSKGNPQTRRVRHVRWVPASGEVDRFFDDEPVSGSRGVAADLLQRVGPFPTKDLVPYDTAYLSGFVVEHYQVVLLEAARKARESMETKLLGICAGEVPGDTSRNLRIYPTWSGETFKHVLVPLWLLAYQFGGKAYQVVVNGSTGAAAGRYPMSPWKVLGLVLALALVAAAVIWVAR